MANRKQTRKSNWKKTKDNRFAINYEDNSAWKSRGKTTRAKDLQLIIARKYGSKKGKWSIAQGSSWHSGLKIVKDVKTKVDAKKEIQKILKKNREQIKRGKK